MQRFVFGLFSVLVGGTAAVFLGFLFAPDPTGAAPLLIAIVVTPLLAFGLYRLIRPDEGPLERESGADPTSSFDRRK